MLRYLLSCVCFSVCSFLLLLVQLAILFTCPPKSRHWLFLWLPGSSLFWSWKREYQDGKIKETFKRGKKKAHVHRSFLHVLLSFCVVQWVTLGEGWIWGALGSILCHSVHPPGFSCTCRLPVGVASICSHFQGHSKIKHPVLSSSSRMEQCKELLLLLSYLAFR